jgi:hypothetical protein
LHSDAAAARDAFQHDRVANAFGILRRLVEGLDKAGTWEKGHSAFLGNFARGMLQAKQREMFGAWSDEDDARFL